MGVLVEDFSGSGSAVVERRRGALIRFTGLPLPKLPARLKAVQHTALVDLAYSWRGKDAKRHFTVHAYRLYGNREAGVYEPRKGRRDRNGRKVSVERLGIEVYGGMVVPLKRSGRLRQRILEGRFQTKPTGGGARVKVKATWPGLPRYVYAYNPSNPALRYRKAQELTILNEMEVEELGRVFERRVSEIFPNEGPVPRPRGG